MRARGLLNTGMRDLKSSTVPVPLLYKGGQKFSFLDSAMFFIYFLVFTLIFTLFENLALAIIVLIASIIFLILFQLLSAKKIQWTGIAILILAFILAGGAFVVKERIYYGTWEQGPGNREQGPGTRDQSLFI